ncbi:hypothetical protein [Gemmatimonas sp.]|uniref:hypothetical protein n=1 Tax=Gemmatimonas sp. TaxID=1962908 RepID=UPI00333E77CC
MTLALRWSKLRLMAAVLVSIAASACTPLRRTVPPDELPQRAVLALDGVDYRDVQDARARGKFASFNEPGRLISTFPSISDVAWHAIFGVYPPAGYQRVFYSTRHNAVLGDALSAISPIEYEERMDYAFDTKFHHLGAYLISSPVARREVDTDIENILSSRGRRTVYLYNVGPDALQHTRGEIGPYLDHLDAKLTELQSRYRARTGRTLEIVLLSDHGHNRGLDAQFVPIIEALAAHGFTAARAITASNHIAFSVDGVTTGFGVFCHADSVQRVAGLLADVPGVDLVTRQQSDSLFFVERAIKGPDGTMRRAEGRVSWRVRRDSAQFGYQSITGDPLALAEVQARMRADGVLDADGFATADVWTRYTAAARYPVAVVRIVHGHLRAARNAAPILVSLDDKYRVGLGMVSVANRMRPLGGTHGALSATNATGIVMSNTITPHDDLAMSVRTQFGGFDDLRDAKVVNPQLDIISIDMLRDDRLQASQWRGVVTLPDTGAVAVLSLPPRYRQWAAKASQLRIEVRRRDQGRDGGTLVRSTVVPFDSTARNSEGSRWAWTAQAFGVTGLTAGEQYTVRVQLERTRRTGDGVVIERAQTVLTAVLTAARDGIPWAY